MRPYEGRAAKSKCKVYSLRCVREHECIPDVERVTAQHSTTRDNGGTSGSYHDGHVARVY
eukprot:9725578-Alexandrium_andersonii.AAC.1